MHWQDNFPFEARRRRNSGSRSGCVGGWRPASWPVEARSGRARARVRPGGAATSPRVPRSLADPQLWAWTRSPAHRRAVSGDPPPPGPRPRAVPGGGRPYAVVRRTRRRAGAVLGAALPAGWGPPTGWHRLRLLRQILDKLVPGVEQFLLVDNVVAVENGPALVPGQEHGDPLGDVRADQVAGGGAPAIVKEAGRHPGRLAGGAPRRAPAPDGDAVAVEDERAVGVAACPPSRQRLGNRL